MVDLDSARLHGRQAIVIAGNKVCKKYRKRMWKKECRNLKAILPTVANKRVSDVQVIEEAVGYIEQLEQAIAQRLGMLPGPQMIAALHMQHFMKIASQANPVQTPSRMPSLSQQTGLTQTLGLIQQREKLTPLRV